MFRALQCPLSGARQTAVAASGFRMIAEVEVFSAVVGLYVHLVLLLIFTTLYIMYSLKHSFCDTLVLYHISGQRSLLCFLCQGCCCVSLICLVSWHFTSASLR